MCLYILLVTIKLFGLFKVQFAIICSKCTSISVGMIVPKGIINTDDSQIFTMVSVGFY